jgi:hypothetical protein
MIVYRSESRRIPSRVLFDEIRGAADARDALIAFGELESGWCDQLPVPGIRQAATALGRWFSGDESARAGFLDLLSALEAAGPPEEIRVSTPEGYAYYALYPESYGEAARQFAREIRPQQVAVIGIRTIGASLSAAVAGALERDGISTPSWTVRPTGHPFNRELTVRQRVRNAWEALARSAWFAIVDEGPGLSGSSFLAVVRAVRGCGVPAERVVLFPSWNPDGSSFVNEEARREWPRYRKYWGAGMGMGQDCILPPGFQPGSKDLSGGRWRGHLGIAVPVNPQHEVLKFLTPENRLFKFAGLGRYGREKLPVAQALADAGYSPPVHSLRHGFLEFEFVPGSPLTAAPVDASFLDFAARYLAFRSNSFPAPARSIDFDALLEMIEFNSKQSHTALRQYRREFEDRPAVYVDARMMPHEWIRNANGWLKTDSVDHSRDHFFPGSADPLWDVAGLFVEFGLGSDQRLYFIRQYEDAAHDCVSPRLLRFYETAYLAFRLGYAAMSGPEFDGLRQTYAAQLGVDTNSRQVIA